MSTPELKAPQPPAGVDSDGRAVLARVLAALRKIPVVWLLVIGLIVWIGIINPLLPRARGLPRLPQAGGAAGDPRGGRVLRHRLG